MEDLERQHGFPSGLLAGVYGAESDFGNNTRNSAAGAVGPFQFMPKTAQEYGLSNPQDFYAASHAAARKLAHLSRYYHGDTFKALAAYNYGEGNVNRLVQTLGANWRQGLPAETAQYLNKVRALAYRYGQG